MNLLAGLSRAVLDRIVPIAPVPPAAREEPALVGCAAIPVNPTVAPQQWQTASQPQPGQNPNPARCKQTIDCVHELVDRWCHRCHGWAD